MWLQRKILHFTQWNIINESLKRKSERKREYQQKEKT